MNLDNCLRKCIECNINKHPKAFVGSRDTCRECWLYLPEEVKNERKVVRYEPSSRTRFLRKKFPQS